MPGSQKSAQPKGTLCSGNVCSGIRQPGTGRPPVIRAVYQDCYIVTLEWDTPAIPGEKKYELHWAASENYEYKKLRDCEHELSKFGTIPLDEREIVCQDGLLITRVVQWDKMDPTNKLKTYWFAVKTSTKSGEIPPGTFTKVERLHWPRPWNLRVEKMNNDSVTIVWDEPAKKTILHEVYGVAYEAAKTQKDSAVASGSLKTKSPTFTIRWDKMDPSNTAERFCFVVSSLTEKMDMINHSDLLCVKRQRSPSNKDSKLRSTKSTISLHKSRKLEGKKHRSVKSTTSIKRVKPEAVKPPNVKVVKQDELFLSLEWDPPAVPGEKKYELHWAGSVKHEFRADQLSEFGSFPTADRTELTIGWHNLDPTNKLTTFWFGVKTFTKTGEIPPVEFVKVVRKECSGSWNMRLVKMNVLGITIAWNTPSWEGHEFFRVVYSATNKQSGVKGITSGKLKIKSTNLTIPWELLDPSNKADTFCFIVSSMTSRDQTISSSPPLFVERESPSAGESHSKKPTNPEVFYQEEDLLCRKDFSGPGKNILVGEEHSDLKGSERTSNDYGNHRIPIVQTSKKTTIRIIKRTNEADSLKPKEDLSEEVMGSQKPTGVPLSRKPLTLRVVKKDFDGVELEWEEPDGIVEEYMVIYTACTKSRISMKSIDNYGKKFVNSRTIYLKWEEMDPDNTETTFHIGVQANIVNSKPRHSEILHVVREWPKPKPPVVRVVKKDGYTVSLQWDPPSGLPGEKRYQLQWAVCEGIKPQRKNVTKTGHMFVESPNAVIAWDKIDPTNEMKTFWFAVKAFNASTVTPTGEFVQVFRRDWPSPWNMRVERINCDGVTIAWDEPAVEDLIGYGVSYTAIEKPGGYVIASGKKMTEIPIFNVLWDKMDPSSRADIFCFMVSAMTSKDVLINSDVFRVKRERLIIQGSSSKSCLDEQEPELFKSARTREKIAESSKSKKKKDKNQGSAKSKHREEQKTESPAAVEHREANLKPNVRLDKQDCYTVSLEWNPPAVPGDKKYELHWAAGLNDEFQTEKLTKFGSIPTNGNTKAVVTWHEMDPTDELKTFWFGVKTVTPSCEVPPGEFLRVKRRDWPTSWNMRVRKVDYDSVSIVWDAPNAQGHQIYAVAYAASEKPGSGVISSGSFKTESPNVTIRWDKMDPTGRADNFCFVVSSMTSDRIVITSSAKYCVQRGKTVRNTPVQRNSSTVDLQEPK